MVAAVCLCGRIGLLLRRFGWCLGVSAVQVKNAQIAARSRVGAVLAASSAVLPRYV